MRWAVLDDDAYVSATLLNGNLWQPEVLYRVLEAAWAFPGATLVELGAYIGDHTVLAAEWFPKVVALEPLFADILRKNLIMNHIQNVEVIEAAIGGVSMIRDPVNPGHSRLGEGEAVRAVTLDAIMPEGRVVLKMDIEGAEYAALKDADLSHVMAVVLEINNEQLFEVSGVHSESVLGILDKWGFGDYRFATGQPFSAEKLPLDWHCDVYTRRVA